MNIEIVSDAPELPYIDGTLQIKDDTYEYAYMGAEGCGNTVYHLGLAEDKTLIVIRTNIQALSGISTLWNEEEVLKVPGVISAEENKQIFREILFSITLKVLQTGTLDVPGITADGDGIVFTGTILPGGQDSCNVDGICSIMVDDTEVIWAQG